MTVGLNLVRGQATKLSETTAKLSASWGKEEIAGTVHEYEAVFGGNKQVAAALAGTSLRLCEAPCLS